MKIIIIKATKNLGKEGEEIEVKDGYAINYLIPNNIATETTSIKGEKKKKINKQQKESLKIKQEDKKEEIKKIPNKLDVQVKANEEGNTFSSVTKDTIIKKLKELGYTIDSDNIEFKPQKSLGESGATISFEDIKRSIIINIVKEE